MSNQFVWVKNCTHFCPFSWRMLIVLALTVQKVSLGSGLCFTSKTTYLLKLKKSDILSTSSKKKKGTTKTNWPPTNTYLLQQRCQIRALSETQWLIFIAASLPLSPSFIGMAKTSLLSCWLSPPLPDRGIIWLLQEKKGAMLGASKKHLSPPSPHYPLERKQAAKLCQPLFSAG